MSRVWSCGFELRSVVGGIEWDGTGGAPQISTRTARSGAASLRCAPAADVAYIQHRMSASGTAPWYVRMYLLVADLPDTGVRVLETVDAANRVTASIKLTATGVLQLIDDEHGQSGSDSPTLAVGAWHRIELEIKSLGSGMVAYLDGTQFAADPALRYGENMTTFRFGAVTPSTCDLYLDDLAVNDSTGTTQTGLPGQGRIVHLRPNGTGDAHEWNTVVDGYAVEASADNWQRVSETQPNDADSYAYRAATGPRTRDSHTVSEHPDILGTDPITLVQVGARIGSTSSLGTRDLALQLTTQAGTTTTGATVTCDVDGWVTHDTAIPRVYSLTSYANPETSAAWTPAELAEAQIGYATVTSEAATRRVSTVWALVEYVDGPQAPPPAPNAEAAGVDSAIAGMPALIAEASFTVQASDPLALHLDDADRGILGTNTLAGELVSTDISAFVRQATTTRGSDRITSPVITYDAGSALLSLDNTDRRFDPTNLDGPYVVAGRSQVTPMRSMRLRARWGSTANLIANPSFEEATTAGWAPGIHTRLSTTTAVPPPAGVHALAVTRTGAPADETHTLSTSTAHEGDVREGFEDSDLAVAVSSAGDADWTRDSTTANTDTWSLKSGDIADTEVTDAIVAVPDRATHLTFAYKTSTEENFDRFYFYIDDTEVFYAHGETPWTASLVHDVTGASTVTFRYDKDASISTGDDAAWVDDIHFQVEGTTGTEGFTGVIGDGEQATISAYVQIPVDVWGAVTAVQITGTSGTEGVEAIPTTDVGLPEAPDTWQRLVLSATVADDTVLHGVILGFVTDGTIAEGTAIAYVDAIQCLAGATPEDFKPNETTYDLMSGFADSWDVAWQDPNESVCEVQFTDAFKVFSNWQLGEASSPLGAGEDTGARVERILDTIGWPEGDRAIATGDTTLQATTFGEDVLSLLQTVAETEIGDLYINGSGKVVFRNRSALFTDARSVHPQAVFGDTEGELRYTEVAISTDDATLANVVRITRSGGTEQTAVDEQSREQFLTRTYSASNLLMQTDAVADDYAQFILYQSSQTELRFEQLILQPLRNPNQLMPLALGLEIGDRIRIRRRPPGGGQLIERDVFVRGINHDITPGFWTTTFALQSATKGSFFVLDDPVLGELDSNALGY